MKRIIITLILIITLLAGCTQNPKTTTMTDIPQPTPAAEPFAFSAISSTQTPVDKASDYFYTQKNVRKTFKGTGNEFASFVTTVDHLSSDTAQIRQDNGGTVSVSVFKLEDGMVKKVFQRGETAFGYNYSSSSNMDEILIKDPISLDNQWIVSNGWLRSILSMNTVVTTPAGEFTTIAVSTIGNEFTQVDYYAKGIGLVKTEYTKTPSTKYQEPKPENTPFVYEKVVSELEKIEENVPATQTVRFYYPDFKKNKLVSIDRKISMNTNDTMESKFQNEFKNVTENKDLTKTLPELAKILSIRVDDEKDIVTVDLSSQFITDMNAGSALEGLILQSIVNTAGHYYNKEKVVITIEGKPYESGHYALKPGQYFVVSDKNAVLIK